MAESGLRDAKVELEANAAHIESLESEVKRLMEAKVAMAHASDSEREKILASELKEVSAICEDQKKQLSDANAALGQAAKDVAAGERTAMQLAAAEREVSEAKELLESKEAHIRRLEATIEKEMETVKEMANASGSEREARLASDLEEMSSKAAALEAEVERMKADLAHAHTISVSA